jgi:hypothetical protein
VIPEHQVVNGYDLPAIFYQWTDILKMGILYAVFPDDGRYVVTKPHPPGATAILYKNDVVVFWKLFAEFFQVVRSEINF